MEKSNIVVPASGVGMEDWTTVRRVRLEGGPKAELTPAGPKATQTSLPNERCFDLLQFEDSKHVGSDERVVVRARSAYGSKAETTRAPLAYATPPRSVCSVRVRLCSRRAHASTGRTTMCPRDGHAGSPRRRMSRKLRTRIAARTGSPHRRTCLSWTLPGPPSRWPGYQTPAPSQTHRGAERLPGPH